jgi:ferric-dicitrate binding protein FerR (iron transport regulator)
LRDLMDMSEPRGPDPIVLARVLSGEATSAEETLVRQWELSDPSHAAELGELRRAWALARPAEHTVDTASAWRGLSARLQTSIPVHASPRVRWPRRRSASRSIVATAAGIAAVLAGITVARLKTIPQTGHPAEQPVTTVYAARVGERALVELDDGTQIALAPASQVRYSRLASGKGVREIHLDGEAVFTVAHDATRPFRVHAAGTVTVDVGTRFGVRAYAHEPLRVAVSEGEVAMASESSVPSADPSIATLPNPSYLRRGDVATQVDGHIVVSRTQRVDALLGWTSGTFAFTHAELGALRNDFERWYGIRIHVAQPSLLRQRITGQFEQESPLEVVQALARALHAAYSRSGADVTFTAQ